MDVEAILEKVFSTAITLGTGTSRVAGFGHVELVVPQAARSGGS